MNRPPDLRLRRGQPRIIGNVLAIAICVIWAFTALAWGLMPGPTKTSIGVSVPPRSEHCSATTVLPEPNC